MRLEHPLYQHVHRVLSELEIERLLDVGGRRSNCTVGLGAEVWISDLPRERAIQETLDLGATDEMRSAVLRRRSNVKEYLYDDMTVTRLPMSYFDAVSAIEVIEHVEDDEQFVRNIARVLRPGGWFVMTTPNGDWKPVPYGDHKRHYTAAQLSSLLSRYFSEVRIQYRVNAGTLFDVGYQSRVWVGMWAYGLCALMERVGFGGRGPKHKHHLVAVCQKN